jgi:small subunit ribosomal protein S6
MLILNPEVEAERQDEIVERVQQLISGGGGEVLNVSDWGRKKIAYAIRKQPDGRYVIVSCTTTPAVLDEVGRVLAINKDVVLRALPIRMKAAEAERVRTAGVPAPVDDRPEGEARAGRPGRGGRGRRPR